MAKSAVITLTSAGTNTGPFNLLSDVDSYTTPFETNISKASLVAGYTSNLIPNAAIVIRVKSNNVTCPNYIDLVYPGFTTTTTTTTTSTTTTTTTSEPILVYRLSNIACGGDAEIYVTGDIVPTLNKFYKASSVSFPYLNGSRCLQYTGTETKSPDATDVVFGSEFITCGCNDTPVDSYLFFTNTGTAGNKGAIVWLAKSNYYAGGSQANLVEPNVIIGSQAGRVPRFSVDVSFWNNTPSNTLDDGLGNLRDPDGTRTIDLSGSFQMAYTSSNGYWRTNNPIFTPGAEVNDLAAFRIDNVTPNPYNSSTVASDASEYTPLPNSNGRIYNIILPDPYTFIRNSNGVGSDFEAGSTGVTFFDLI